MERIGIIVAMDKEFDLLKPLLLNHTTQFKNGREYVIGQLCNKEIVMQKCGVGKVNAAAGATEMIIHYQPTSMISTGVAGALQKGEKPMDIVIAEICRYHDVYCGRYFPKGQVQGFPPYYPANGFLLGVARQAIPQAVVGTLVSGDQFVDNIDGKMRILSDFPEAIAVDMESSAIAQVCFTQTIPFLAIRVISDSCNDEDYDNFWKELSERSFNATLNFIKELANEN